jgi:hypothetical protein
MFETFQRICAKACVIVSKKRLKPAFLLAFFRLAQSSVQRAKSGSPALWYRSFR